jgi:predicted transcriptional regulator
LRIKLILREKTIEDESIVDIIFKILGDKYSRKILESLTESPKSALEISKECEISITLSYRKLKILKKYKLVLLMNSVLVRGRKYGVYKSKAHPIMILLN